MVFGILFLLQYLLCATELSYTFDFIIHRNITENFESHYTLKFESKAQLCYGSSLICTSVFISPNSLYSWVQNSTYIDRRKGKTSGDPHSDDYGQFYLKDELIYEVYKFNDNIEIDSFTSSDISLLFSKEIKHPQIHSSIGLIRSKAASNYISFLEQIYHHKEVDKDEFTIQYISNTSGRITFGGLSKSNRTLMYTLPIPSSEFEKPQALVSIDSLSINNKICFNNFKVNIDESFGFIQFPEVYKHLIDTDDFKPVLKKYFKERHYYIPSSPSNYWQNITYYVCDKYNMKAVLDQLPSIAFESSQVGIKLKRENMLIEYENDQMIFAIVFAIGNLTIQKSLWVLGEPFLKDYDIEHNFEDNKIKLYQRESPLITVGDIERPTIIYYFVLIISLIGMLIQLLTLFQIKHIKQ